MSRPGWRHWTELFDKFWRNCESGDRASEESGSSSDRVIERSKGSKRDVPMTLIREANEFAAIFAAAHLSAKHRR